MSINANMFRCLASIGFSRYEVNIFGDIRAVGSEFIYTPHKSCQKDNIQGKALCVHLVNDNGQQRDLPLSKAVRETWWDVDEQDIPENCQYKDTILAAKEFYLIPSHDRCPLSLLGINWYADSTTGEYVVTRYGDVWNIKNKQKLKPKLEPSSGYLRVSVSANKDYYSYGHNSVYIHLLVARAFLPKPGFNQTAIIHKDKDLTNNKWWNLQWATPQERAEFYEARKSNVPMRSLEPLGYPGYHINIYGDV